MVTAEGEALVDDPSIRDEFNLWRRICPQWWHYDEKQGRHRLTSAAFNNHPNGSPMSVTIGEEATGTEVLLDGLDGYGVAAFPARTARRDCGQKLLRDPIPENPAHAHVAGKKTAGVRKRLCSASVILVEPSPRGSK